MASCDHSLTPGQYVFSGVIFDGFVNRRVLNYPWAVKCRDDDVFVVTYPKCGTTWTTEIVSLIMNGGDVKANQATQQDVRHPLLEMYAEDFLRWKWLFNTLGTILSLMPDFIRNRFEWLPCGRRLDAFNALDYAETLPSPRLFKSHLHHNFFPSQAIQKQCKVIYVSRNPKDMAVSYYNFLRIRPDSKKHNISSWNLFYRLFMENRVGYGDWFRHVLGWWEKRDDENVLFLKYEDMKENPLAAVQKISTFLCKKLTEEVEEKIADFTSFHKMKANKAVNSAFMTKMVDGQVTSFIRKGVVGDWRNYFTVAQNEEFDKVYEERMDGSGLHFDWK